MHKIFLSMILALLTFAGPTWAQSPTFDFKAEKKLLQQQQKLELKHLNLQWKQWKQSIKGQPISKAELTRMKHEMQRRMRDLKQKQKDERQELKDRQRLLKEYQRNIQ